MESVFLKYASKTVWVLIFILFGCNSLFYFPTDKIYYPPEKFKLRYADHYFKTANGVKLHGRVLFHKDTAAYRGLFVQFHGNAENLTSHYLALAWVLNHGYDLFVFDYAGYGQSEGEASRPGSIESGRAALQLITDSLLPEKSRLVLVGQSLGGAILMRCASEWKSVNAATLILVEGTFPSYRKEARSAVGRTWLKWILQPLAFLFVSDGNSPAPVISQISPVPLVVAYCKEDPVIEPRFSNEIFNLAREPKWLWEFSNCGHIQGFRKPENQEHLLKLVDSLALAKENLNGR